MYLIVIAWMYVVLMMSVAEATHSTGTLLGAVITFVLYGVGPVSLVVYLMRAPARRKAIKAREAAETATADPEAHLPDSFAPDAGGHAAGSVVPVAVDASVTPVRKEP
ncbi:MAG: hypothetical protein Q8O29_04915 [Polaromonas sp.]|uniref:hypothetical protein n=1 Tax=Polaromonas sp. TaxID=1869339 RepID=UPI00273664B0|nr:hypothetical protein [Polaromonas sp.]MDP2817611.1 hypothetical protein [Polaromonas sp.]